MREDDGRKLDHRTLEAIRIRAVRGVKAGEHPEVVAKTLGMSRAAVYSWLAQAREGGLDALRAKPVPGRPPKLSGAQLRRVDELVVGRDPRQLRFPFALWTREMVGELIEREFGVTLSLKLGRPPPAPARPLAPATPVPGVPAGPRGRRALEARAVPDDPGRGRSGRSRDLLR